MRRKFLFRTFVFIFLSSLMSTLLFAFLIYYQTQKENHKIAQNQATQVQEEVQKQLSNIIHDYEVTADTWSQEEIFQRVVADNDTTSLNEVYNIIYSTLADKQFKAEVTIINPESDIILTTTPESALVYQSSQNNWGIFREIQASQSSVIYIPLNTPASNHNIALTIGTPIINQFGLIGYIMINFPHAVFNELYHSQPVPYHVDIVLSDTNYFSFFDSRTVKQSNQFLSEPFQFDYSRNSHNIDEIQTDNTTILKRNINNYGLTIYTVFSFRLFENLAAELLYSSSFLIIIIFIISALISYLLAITLYRPIRIIIKNMKMVEEGNLEVHFPVETDDEMSSINAQFNRMMITIRNLIKENDEKQQSIRVAEIKALQSQMKPHFIFNVLNSVKFMARLNNVPAIDDMVTSLATLLRSNIAIDKETETISDSVQFVKNYLKIQKYRYDDNINYQIYMEEAIEDVVIPRLIIQPLIENSIEHGIEEIDTPGKIFLSAIKKQNMCVLIIEDNGIGIDPDIALNFKDPNWSLAAHSKNNGIALKNIYERLSYYFKGQAEMNIHNTGGTSIIITIPLRRE